MVESNVNALDSASREKSESANQQLSGVTNHQTSANRSNSESSLTGAHFAANDRA